MLAGQAISRSDEQRTVIMHLSDLHFGSSQAPQDADVRLLALRSLTETVCAVDACWRPTCICISGDIGYRGKASAYKEAQAWLHELLSALGLGPESLIACPGNHDMDRDVAAANPRAGSPEEADNALLDAPRCQSWVGAFGKYGEFCRAMGILPAAYGEDASHLVGVRELQGIRFVILNSAWYLPRGHG